MKISVLTPTYNDGISIKETLQTLISQTYSNWEWIVINDGSTDDTDDIMKSLIAEYQLENKCFYLRQENGDQLNALLNGCNHITGDYVFILHSDDLLPSETFFQQCIDEMKKNRELEGIFGDLLIIDEKSETTGMQNVKKYEMNQSLPALMLLWLGRNIFADFAFHKTECFMSRVRENYLTWNMPFWLYYEEEPRMVNYKKVEFPILKYRVHGENYINNELGMHNVLNGELRTAIKLMHYYDIPHYKYQYMKYRLLNKLGLSNTFCVKYRLEETKNKAEIIDFIIKKRFPAYEDKLYFYSIYQFYKNRQERVLDMSCFLPNVKIYCGKDMRAFNKQLLGQSLDENYMWFMQEMRKGFNKIVNYEHLGRENMRKILQFFCIEEEVEL